MADPQAPRAGIVTPTRERWLYYAGLLLFLVVLSLRRLGDFDLPWHLALGRYVVGTRSIPNLDPLSFTHQTLRYLEPVTEVPMYLLYRVGGAAALQITFALLAALLGVIVQWPLRRQGSASYLVTSLMLAASCAWLIVRPATVSFVLIALVLALIELHRTGTSGGSHQGCRVWARRALVFGSPLGLLLWASAHGFSLIGAGFLVAYAAYRVLCWTARGRLGAWLPERDGVDAWPLLASAILSLVASVWNIRGPILRLGPGRWGTDVMNQLAATANTELVGPTLAFFRDHAPLGPLLVVLGILALVFGRSEDGKRSPPTAYDVGLVAAGCLGVFWMVRTVPIGTLVLAPVIGRRLGYTIPSTPITRWACATTSTIVALYAAISSDTSSGFGFEPSHYPEGAVRYIESQKLRGKMYNFAPVGGYLAWRLYPNHLVFMDGRYENAREPRLVLQAVASLFREDTFAQLTEQIGFDYAIMGAREGEPFGEPLARSPDWVMVYFDDVAAVYLRKQRQNQEQLPRGYRVLRHLTPLQEVLVRAIQAGPRAPELHADGKLAVAQDPNSARAAFIAACGALGVRDQAEFTRALTHLATLAPRHPAIEILLAQAAAIWRHGDAGSH